jgi:hypothetical protein
LPFLEHNINPDGNRHGNGNLDANSNRDGNRNGDGDGQLRSGGPGSHGSGSAVAID